MKEFPVEALRSVELSTPDLPKSVAFYTRVWGLEQVAEKDGKVFLAASGDDFHVLELKAGETAALRKTTFRARSAKHLEQLHAGATAAGQAILRPLGAAEGPSGGKRFVIRGPDGSCLEFVHGDLRRTPRPKPDVPVRLAHVNLNTTDIEEVSAFYSEVLGFRLTDRSKMMAFLSCNSDHHSVVLADAKADGLNHVAFLQPALEDVMRGAGRMIDHGHPIGWGVGRHGPGDNIFAYFIDPTGVVIEYTAEVLQVDENYRFRGPEEWMWPPGRADQWGIAPPKSEDCKAAQLAILHARL